MHCCVVCWLQSHASHCDDFAVVDVEQTTQLPLDFKTESGEPFWSGAKRFPKVVHYDANDQYHVMFVTAMANILAAAFGLVPAPENERNLLPVDHEWRSPDFINGIVRTLPVPEYCAVKISMEGAGDGKVLLLLGGFMSVGIIVPCFSYYGDVADQRRRRVALRRKARAWKWMLQKLRPS